MAATAPPPSNGGKPADGNRDLSYWAPRRQPKGGIAAVEVAGRVSIGREAGEPDPLACQIVAAESR